MRAAAERQRILDGRAKRCQEGQAAHKERRECEEVKKDVKRFVSEGKTNTDARKK